MFTVVALASLSAAHHRFVRTRGAHTYLPPVTQNTNTPFGELSGPFYFFYSRCVGLKIPPDGETRAVVTNSPPDNKFRSLNAPRSYLPASAPPQSLRFVCRALPELITLICEVLKPSQVRFVYFLTGDHKTFYGVFVTRIETLQISLSLRGLAFEIPLIRALLRVLPVLWLSSLAAAQTHSFPLKLTIFEDNMASFPEGLCNNPAVWASIEGHL